MHMFFVISNSLLRHVLYFFRLLLVPPHVVPFIFESDINYGDSVQVSCHITKGDLPLTIKWLFNDKPIFAHLNILTSKFGNRSSFLTVPAVTADNGGNYTCTATNDAGQHNHTAVLNVLGT